MYQPACRVLSRKYEFDVCDTADEARAVYLNFQTRAFELIEALMKRDIPVEIQWLILDFWVQRLRGRKNSKTKMLWLESQKGKFTSTTRV